MQSYNKQGDIALTRAMNYFVSKGYTVSIPLSESQRYDLVVDDGVHRYRVEVKSSFKKVKTPNANTEYYVIRLVTMGRDWNKRTKLSSADCEYVFIATAEFNALIPTMLIEGRDKIKLGPKWQLFKI